MNRDRKRGAQKTYTCAEYREEMILLSLRKQLKDNTLPSQKRKELEDQITQMEKTIGL